MTLGLASINFSNNNNNNNSIKLELVLSILRRVRSSRKNNKQGFTGTNIRKACNLFCQ